jgi:hypothetical protein
VSKGRRWLEGFISSGIVCGVRAVAEQNCCFIIMRTVDPMWPNGVTHASIHRCYSDMVAVLYDIFGLEGMHGVLHAEPSSLGISGMLR